MRLILIPCIILLSISALAQPKPTSIVPVVPEPQSVQLDGGHLSIDRAFSVAITGFRDPMLERGVQRFQDELSRETGIPFFPNSASRSTLTVHAGNGIGKVQKLTDDESYQLSIAESGATLNAPTTLGILHGLQTFLQLVQPGTTGFAVPTGTIKDQPRFPWRGLLIDVARHFIPVFVLKRNLDGMAAVKMNVLHWHLYDNEGFRIESERFPKLQEKGSNGQYYSQEQIRDLVAYAHDRGIRVLPEFEMPGHSRSLFAGYPELASGPGPYRVEPGGAEAAIDPTREEIYKFIDKFVDEMSKLFPDEYLHIGGDEVDGHQWDSNPKIQAFMHAHKMKSNQDLQAYFNQRLQKILSKHHKVMMGWDEVLHPDLPKTVVVQSWRGQESLAAAARQSYRGLLSFGYYLDLMWPAERHYAIDPMSDGAASLNAEEKARILGGEACMWAEFISPENIDSRIWPRNAAIAERLWSSPEVRDPASMYARLGQLSWRLEFLGLTQRSSLVSALHRLTGTDDISALKLLAQVVEPVKDYTRMDDLYRTKKIWDFQAPLNRLVDNARPESDQARIFKNSVQAFIASHYQDKSAESEIRRLLTTWRDNDAALSPMLKQSFLLGELAPLSEDLSTTAAAGLFALDYLDKSTPSPDQWRQEQHAILERAKTSKADLLLMIVQPVEDLIEAGAGNPRKP